MRIECGLCALRDWQPRDEAALVAAANNRNAWRNLHHRFPHPYTQADAIHWFSSLAATHEPTHWAILRAADTRAVELDLVTDPIPDDTGRRTIRDTGEHGEEAQNHAR